MQKVNSSTCWNLENKKYTFCYDLKSGYFGMRTEDGAWVEASSSITFRAASGIMVEATSSQETVRRHSVVANDGKTSLKVVTPLSGGNELTQEFQFDDASEFAALRIGLRMGDGAPSVNAHYFRPLHSGGEIGGLSLNGSMEDWRIFNLGYQSWSPSGSKKLYEAQDKPNFQIARVMGFNPVYRNSTRPGTHMCDWMAAVKDTGTRQTFLCGFVTAADQAGHIYISADKGRNELRHFYAQSDADGVEARSGMTLNSETLMFGFTPDALNGMNEYAETMGREMKAVTWSDVPTGWCSWYKYYTKITENDVVQNLPALEKFKDNMPVRYIQLDDGYQTAVGDWMSVDEKKFPRGMPFLTKRIQESDFLPGIWVAPFFARTNSELFRKRKELFLKDAEGKYVSGGFNVLWGGKLAALDLSHPDTLEWLRATFHTIVHEWGYRYLKLDFLYAGMMPGVRHDPNVTRVQAYRRALQVIRDVAGDDVFILGCGAPIGPSVGIFNGMRISTDVGPSWISKAIRLLIGTRTEPSVVSCISNCVTRSFLHGRLWFNDPDCVMLRRGKLTGEEMQTFVTALSLTGGMTLISDNMREVESKGLNQFRRMVPPSNVPATPLDLMDGEYPALFIQKFANGRAIAAVINWEDQARVRRVDFETLGVEGPCHVFDYWHQKYLGVLSDELPPLSIPPHGCGLFKFTPEEAGPALLSSTLHMAQGEMEIKDWKWDAGKGLLRVRINLPGKREGMLFIATPQGRRNASLENIKDGRAETHSLSDMVEVAVDFENEMTFDMLFT